MKFQLVIQFDTSSLEEFDNLVALEDSLELKLGVSHEVDGHDFGSGEMNIFINTNDPESAFTICKKTMLEFSGFEYIAAFRAFDSDEYTIISPSITDKEFTLK